MEKFQAKLVCCVIWTTLAPRIRATPVPVAKRVPSTAPTCVRVPTASKEWTARKTSTNAKPARRANTTDCASTLPDRSSATARADSPDLAARSTSTNATRIRAKTTAPVWTSAALSDAFACQVRVWPVSFAYSFEYGAPFSLEFVLHQTQCLAEDICNLKISTCNAIGCSSSRQLLKYFVLCCIIVAVI